MKIKEAKVGDVVQTLTKWHNKYKVVSHYGLTTCCQVVGDGDYCFYVDGEMEVIPYEDKDE